MKKVAMIGCGGIGKYHLGHLVEFHDIELAGFCDLIIEKAEDFVKQAGSGKAFVDFEKMYDEVQPDMVFICVPPYAHGYIEYETINRNIPFFVEKPLALDMDMAYRILEKIEEKNLITAVGFQVRYANYTDAAKKYVDENRIVHAAGSRVGGIPGVSWWRIKSQSGGQLVEQTIHQMDMLRYLLGEPEMVFSVATRGVVTEEDCKNYDTDDMSTTLITFKNGTTATMMTGCYSKNGASWDSKMTFGSVESRMDYVMGSHVALYGVAEEDKAAEVAGVISGDGTQRKSDNEKGIRFNRDGDPGILCDRTFVDAVITGDPSKIRSPYRDGIESVRFTLACNESMETGLPVYL